MTKPQFKEPEHWHITTIHSGVLEGQQTLRHRCNEGLCYCYRSDSGWYCRHCKTNAPEEIVFVANLVGAISIKGTLDRL